MKRMWIRFYQPTVAAVTPDPVWYGPYDSIWVTHDSISAYTLDNAKYHVANRNEGEFWAPNDVVYKNFEIGLWEGNPNEPGKPDNA